MRDWTVSRRKLLGGTAALGVATAAEPLQAAQATSPAAINAAMLKAARYMVEKVSHQGGYVWQVLPDRSREWGEMEANPTSVWIQHPSTPLMGHLFLDAYHATGEAYFYRAASMAADVLIRGQHPSGGWNYHFDLAGEAPLKRWYQTVGKNGWRLEEFQHYIGNATFDDRCTADCASFMLRMYLEKRGRSYKASLDNVIDFVLKSQYPVGGWPQRFPLHHGDPAVEYANHITFNDDVAGENILFLLMVWQSLGDRRVLDPIARGMDCFVRAQQPMPQPGWGLQHRVADLKPAAARTYEPEALTSHTTAGNIGLMMDFYELTGDPKFLRRLPEAMDWLESIRLPASVDERQRCPTFIAPGTNKPIFIHREGSNVFNGRYFGNDDPKGTIVHYSSFRAVNVAALRTRYQQLAAAPATDVVAGSPLKGGRRALPRYFSLDSITFADLRATARQEVKAPAPDAVAKLLASLDDQGRWITPLRNTSHRYTRDGSRTPAPGDFSQSNVGDETDTSPYPDPQPAMGISTEQFVQNMGVLIRAHGGQA